MSNKVVDVILHCQKQLKKEKLSAEKLLHYLGRLSRLRITVLDLAETGIGRTVNSLSRNEGSVGQAAETLVRGWKQMVSEQQSQAEAQARKSAEEESDSNSGSSDEEEDELNNDANEPYDIDEQVENPVEPYQNGNVNEVGPPSGRNEEFADEDDDVDDIEDPYMTDGFLNMTNVHTDEEDEEEDESEQDSDSDAADNLRIADDGQQQMQRATDPFKQEKPPREPEYLKGKAFIKQEIQSETEDLKVNPYVKQEKHRESGDFNKVNTSTKQEKQREPADVKIKQEKQREPENPKGSHHQSSSSNSKSHPPNEKSRNHSPGSKESTKEHKHHKSKEHRSSKHGDHHSESRSRHHHSSKERQHEKEKSSSKDKQRSKESSSHRDSKSDKERERSKEKKDSTNQNRSNNTSASTHHHSKDKDRSREMSSLKSSSSPERKKSELHEERKRKDPSDDGASTLNKKPKLVIKEEIDSTSGVNFADVLGSLDVPCTSSSKLKKIKKEIVDYPTKSHDKHESRKKKHESSTSSAGSSKHSREQEGSSSSRKAEKDSERSKLSKKPIHVKLEPVDKPAVHISPNYKPVHPLLPTIPRPSTSNGSLSTLPLSQSDISDLGGGDYWDNNEKDFTGMSQEDAISTMLSNRNARSKVFSGVKSARRGDVPTLFDLSMQVIKDNIGELGYTGGIPYDILKPALERANPQQLTNIESQNDHLIGETDELWQFHCRRDFRGHCPAETESWRDLYERCKDGQQQKFEQIRKKMKMDMMKRETAEPVRKTKLAYVEITSGPRFHKEKAQTIKNGMKTLKIKEEKGVKRGVSSSASAGFNNPKVTADPTKVIVQEASVIIAPDSRSGHAPAPSVSRDREYVAKQKPKKAPLMQKTMKLIRSLNRR